MNRVSAKLALLCCVLQWACNPALPNDLPSLIQSMASNDQTVSVNAALKVHALFGKEGLLTALRAGGPGARQTAALHLRDYPGVDVEQSLIKSAEEESEPFIRSAVLYALGGVGTAASLPVVTRATKDSSPVVANSASTALDEIHARLRIPN